MRRNRTTLSDYIALLGIFTLITCCFACVPTQLPQTATTPTLNIAMIDVSGSFKEKGFSLTQYKTITDSLLTKGNGSSFVVLGLGNFPQSEAMIEFCPKPLNKPVASPTMDEVRSTNASNESIITSNTILQDTFLHRIERLILQYNRVGKEDYTIIDYPLEKARLLINEQRFNGYNTNITILSDGVNENTEGKPIPITAILTKNGTSSFKLTLSGWSAPKTCFGNASISETANADGLFQSILSNLSI
jgi:hypothetical protein